MFLTALHKTHISGGMPYLSVEDAVNCPTQYRPLLGVSFTPLQRMRLTVYSRQNVVGVGHTPLQLMQVTVLSRKTSVRVGHTSLQRMQFTDLAVTELRCDMSYSSPEDAVNCNTLDSP